MRVTPIRLATALLAASHMALAGCGGGGGSLEDIADRGCATLEAAGPEAVPRGDALGEALVDGADHGHLPEETLEAMLTVCPELLPGVDGIRMPRDKEGATEGPETRG